MMRERRTNFIESPSERPGVLVKINSGQVLRRQSFSLTCGMTCRASRGEAAYLEKLGIARVVGD